jgi:hypothetical protein
MQFSAGRGSKVRYGFFRGGAELPDQPKLVNVPSLGRCRIFSQGCLNKDNAAFHVWHDDDFWLIHEIGAELIREYSLAAAAGDGFCQLSLDEAVKWVNQLGQLGFFVQPSGKGTVRMSRTIKEIGEKLTDTVKGSKSLHAAFLVTTTQARTPVVTHDTARVLGWEDEHYDKYGTKMLRTLLDSVELVNSFGRDRGGSQGVMFEKAELDEVFFHMKTAVVVLFKCPSRNSEFLIGVCDPTRPNVIVAEIEGECREVIQWLDVSSSG